MISTNAAVGKIRRALNAGGRVAERAGIDFVRLDARGLRDEAHKQTRLQDFEDDGLFPQALDLLVRSLDTEAGLSLLGRIAAVQDLSRLLVNRLRLVDDRRRFPAIADETIRRPLFVTGLPRTGTTLLHGLLAQDPANRAPLHWEMVYPSPPPGRFSDTTERRIGMADRQMRWFDLLAPELRRIHPLGARLPEECLIIHSHSLLSWQFQTSHHVPTYETWLEAQDLCESYAWHKRFLQQLQWRGPKERWVLKAPAHLFGIRALFATYPDACVVFTHREPLEVAPSLASLTTVLRRTFSDEVDPVAVGREMTERWAGAVNRALDDRAAGVAPAGQFHDVMYVDLMRDPIGTVARLYAHFDLPFTAGAEDRMRSFLAANPKDKNGAHRYTLESYGFDRDAEAARYRSYRERVGL